MVVRIGTSGFSYEHWRGTFYPSSARTHELERYAAAFDTVELNVTFYRTPAARTFDSWAHRAPADFVFAVKASRYLTHVLRLRDPEEPVAFLLERTADLGSHRGPFLLQLPPDMEAAPGALARTLDAFPAGVRVAVEPRHDTWFVDEVRSILAERNAALCLADRRGPLGPVWRTADWAYLRFHAGRAHPSPCYGDQALDTWAGRLAEGWGRGADAYVYFNNDGRGCALRDASRFAVAAAGRGMAVGRVAAIGDEVLRA